MTTMTLEAKAPVHAVRTSFGDLISTLGAAGVAQLWLDETGERLMTPDELAKYRPPEPIELCIDPVTRVTEPGEMVDWLTEPDRRGAPTAATKMESGVVEEIGFWKSVWANIRRIRAVKKAGVLAQINWMDYDD